MSIPGRAAQCWLVAALAAAGLAVLTVSLLRGGWVLTADRHLELAVLVHQHRPLRALADATTWLGDPVTVGLVVALATAALAVRRDRVRAVALPVAVTATLLAAQVARHAIGRSAPTFGSHLHWPGGDAYPSGHALGAALCLAAVAVAARRRWVTGAAVVLSVLVAAGRVYAFAHFPSDVAASLLAAAAAVAVVEAAAETLSRRRCGG